MDLLSAILDALPWAVAAILAVASTVALLAYADKLPPWAVALLKVVRGSSLARLLRVGKVSPAQPQPLDPERAPDLPPATSNVTTDTDNPGGENGGSG